MIKDEILRVLKPEIERIAKEAIEHERQSWIEKGIDASFYNVTTRELSEIIGVQPQSIAIACKTGRLKYTKIGGRNVFNTKELLENIHKTRFNNLDSVIENLRNYNQEKLENIA